jgi:hypothetical protein
MPQESLSRKGRSSNRLPKVRLLSRGEATTPGGSDEHYGVVHYGTNPKELSQTAKSHIRLNQTHSYAVFRVRIDDLKPRTTYYYTVDSMEANGRSDGVKSPVRRFTTQRWRKKIAGARLEVWSGTHYLLTGEWISTISRHGDCTRIASR